MTRHDPLGRKFIAAQAVRGLTRSVRGLELCKCGKEYEPTADGRRRHQMVLEHVPVRDEEVI